jgi:hypothetical protein
MSIWDKEYLLLQITGFRKGEQVSDTKELPLHTLSPLDSFEITRIKMLGHMMAKEEHILRTVSAY